MSLIRFNDCVQPINTELYIFLLAMTDNAHDSSDEFPPFVDIVQLESQLQSEDAPSKDEQDDLSPGHCQLWVNWHFFVLPGLMREMQISGKKKEELDFQDVDRFVPKTRLGRQLGVMQYVLREEGKLLIEELLCIDVVLGRIRSFSPSMPGVDRYDEMGVLQLHHGLRQFVQDFFSLTPKQRRKILTDFENAGHFSYEISHLIKRLENLSDIPKAKKRPSNSLPQSKDARVWPDGLAGRDLELFKLLSGIESTSPRNQALSVLNFILPNAPSSDAASEGAPAPIRFEPGDKERIARLLKRFPSLKNRYPYLLKMIENGIPAEKFNAESDNQEHYYNGALPTYFFFPSVLADPPKKPEVQNWFSNRFVKWGIIIAVICSLIKIAGILLSAWVK